jgi:hypothetical protein
MLKAIWMSDPHFTNGGNFQGHSPRVRLRAAIDHINQHHSSPARMITGTCMKNQGLIANKFGVIWM